MCRRTLVWLLVVTLVVPSVQLLHGSADAAGLASTAAASTCGCDVGAASVCDDGSESAPSTPVLSAGCCCGCNAAVPGGLLTTAPDGNPTSPADRPVAPLRLATDAGPLGSVHAAPGSRSRERPDPPPPRRVA